MLIAAKQDGKLKDEVTVARINGNALENINDYRCGAFFDALVRKGWWLAGSQGQWAIQKKAVPPAASPPNYGGWSAIDTYVATRTAHTEEAVRILSHQQMPDIVGAFSPQLRLDILEGFDESCAENISVSQYSLTKPDELAQNMNSQPACMRQNVQICFSALHARRAPLGWFLSRGSGKPIELSAVNAAARLIAAMNR
jgi:hypothetical protein